MIPHFCAWFVRKVALSAAALSVLLVPAVAIAQTITVGNATSPNRDPGTQGHNEQTSISAADCRANDEISYRVTTAGVGGESLEVWVGTSDCTARDARVGVNRSCWLAWRETAVLNTTRFIPLRAQDIVSRNLTAESPGAGTIASCSQQIGVTDKEKHTLQFMLVNSNFDFIPGSLATAEIFIDLVGPAPPTDVKAGVGEERIVLSWEPGQSRDRLGFNFYCDPPPGPIQTTTMQGDAGPIDDGAGGAADAAGGVGGASGTAGTDDGGAGAPTDGAAGAPTDGAAGTGIGGGGGTDAGTTEGGVGNDACPSALRSQTVPDPRFLCGSVGPNAFEGEATGLVNYQLYAVGVAARDKLENPGLLSEIKCGTPQEVDDFFEVYKRAGGQGGGGFCSFGAQPAYGAGILFAVAALAHWLRRRRR